MLRLILLGLIILAVTLLVTFIRAALRGLQGGSKRQSEAVDAEFYRVDDDRGGPKDKQS